MLGRGTAISIVDEFRPDATLRITQRMRFDVGKQSPLAEEKF
jgi:hypothetical protein